MKKRGSVGIFGGLSRHQVPSVESPHSEPTARAFSFWERRYILRHFQEHGDESLAMALSCSPRRIGEFLASQKALRTAAQAGRIAKRGPLPAPTLLTPRRLVTRLTSIRTRPLSSLDGLLLAAMFVGSLTLYALTAARTVTGEDAGELIAAAHGLGVPHPPGYQWH